MSWFESSVVYQIYPLGLTGAPHQNPLFSANVGDKEQAVCRLRQLVDAGWLDHIQSLGCTCLLLNPVFQSTSHGYDTVDYTQVDARLGTKEDLAFVVAQSHARGIKVVLDAVLNHVGRDFWAFKDVQANGPASPYAGWFNINWDANNAYNDGFSYECWEGVAELVKLNHDNFDLNAYLTQVIQGWKRDFDIDGLRLDVAYCLPQGYLHYLRQVADELGLVLVGETMFGDYNQWMGPDYAHSCTNYEVYKGLWSSANEKNMHEVAYSLNRQFGSEPWCLYTGTHLLEFLDNHDVDRIATKLSDPQQLVPLYGLLFAIPGVPALYYGSEWGTTGAKGPGDYELRPAFAAPQTNELTALIGKLAHLRTNAPVTDAPVTDIPVADALVNGTYRELHVSPTTLAFERQSNSYRVLFAANLDGAPQTLSMAHVLSNNAPKLALAATQTTELTNSDALLDPDKNLCLPSYSFCYLVL